MDMLIFFLIKFHGQKNMSKFIMVLEKTLESPLDSKEVKLVIPKGNQSWIFIGRTDAEAEAPILWPPDVKHHFIWKRPCCWTRLRARGEEDDRGWDGWMASLTRWTWVGVNSGSWWWTGRPDMLRFMGLQRVGHDWATELNWTEHPYLWRIHYKVPSGCLKPQIVILNPVCTVFFYTYIHT